MCGGQGQQPTPSPSLAPTWLQLFLGQLRSSEVERVTDRASQAVLETCLAMTIFRQDLGPGILAVFVLLCFLKVLNWIVADRVDFLESTPALSRLTSVRLVAFNVLLLVRPRCARFCRCLEFVWGRGGVPWSSPSLPHAWAQACPLAHVTVSDQPCSHPPRAPQVAQCMMLQHTMANTMRVGVSLHFLFAFEAATAATSCLVTLIKFCMCAGWGVGIRRGLGKGGIVEGEGAVSRGRRCSGPGA